ncbi:MAG: hypothetical protein ACFFAI_10000 [Promethearchaeota archaeon]
MPTGPAMRFCEGKVNWIFVKKEQAMFQLDTLDYFIIWYYFPDESRCIEDQITHAIWLDLLRDAMNNDRIVRIGAYHDSSVALSVQTYRNQII